MTLKIKLMKIFDVMRKLLDIFVAKFPKCPIFLKKYLDFKSILFVSHSFLSDDQLFLEPVGHVCVCDANKWAVFSRT